MKKTFYWFVFTVIIAFLVYITFGAIITNVVKDLEVKPKYQKEYSVTHYDGNNNITGTYYMKCTPKQMVEWCEKTPHILSNGSVDNIIIFKTGRIEVNLINNEKK